MLRRGSCSPGASRGGVLGCSDRWVSCSWRAKLPNGRCTGKGSRDSPGSARIGQQRGVRVLQPEHGGIYSLAGVALPSTPRAAPSPPGFPSSSTQAVSPPPHFCLTSCVMPLVGDGWVWVLPGGDTRPTGDQGTSQGMGAGTGKGWSIPWGSQEKAGDQSTSPPAPSLRCPHHHQLSGCPRSP